MSQPAIQERRPTVKVCDGGLVEIKTGFAKERMEQVRMDLVAESFGPMPSHSATRSWRRSKTRRKVNGHVAQGEVAWTPELILQADERRRRGA